MKLLTKLSILFFILTLSIAATKGQNSAPEKQSDKTKKEDNGNKDARKNKEDKEKARELANDKIKLEKITSTLKYGVQKDRKDALKLMNRINDKSLLDKALEQLPGVIDNDEDSEIKRTALTVAGDMKYKPAVPSIIRALDDSNEDVVISASYALRKMKAMEGKAKLIELLKKRSMKENSNVTDSFIVTLGDLEAKEILDFAIENINKPDTSKMTRERLVLFVGKTGSAAQKDFLLKLYNDEDEEMLIRSYAVKSIGSLKIIAAKDDVKKKIKEIKSYPFKKRGKYYQLFINSVATLVKLGDNESVPLLMDSLRSNDAGVRYKAISLIKEFDDERTIDILKYKMKNDPSEKVRRAAKKALIEKGIIDKDKSDKDDKEEEGDKDNDAGDKKQNENS